MGLYLKRFGNGTGWEGGYVVIIFNFFSHQLGKHPLGGSSNGWRWLDLLAGMLANLKQAATWLVVMACLILVAVGLN